MSNCRIVAGIVAFVVFSTLGGAVYVHAEEEKQYPILSPCAGAEDLFPRYPDLEGGEEDRVDAWRRIYHTTANDVSEAHLKHTEIACTENARETPSGTLLDLAAKLPPWSDDEDISRLTERDIGAVLLEHLRIYECSLKEHAFFLPSDIDEELLRRGGGKYERSLHTEELSERQEEIGAELKLSRRALHRTLAAIGGIDRLRPLSASLECLQRASLDIRNILGLTADTAACLPRTWDARGSLRDLYAPPPTETDEE